VNQPPEAMTLPPAAPGQILLNQRAHAAVEDVVDAEEIGELTLMGFSRPIQAVNVIGLRSK